LELIEMIDPENEFVIEGVAHAYNLSPDNYSDVVSASTITELAYLIGGVGSPDPKYDVPRDVYISDWSIEDLAKLLFLETATDIAVVHNLPLYCYTDGMVSLEKAAEAVTRYPNRFRAYAGIDPLRDSLEDLDHQVELLNHPTGLKLYPTSWNGTTVTSWKMNDPKVIYPFYERAREHGIKVIAVHKAVPLGPIVTDDAFNPGDLESAAGAFPDLTFEIVHGGIAFAEETAWLLSRFSNIYINLELSNIILERRPRTFSKMLVQWLSVGGMPMLDRLLWGTGAMIAHPRATLDAFCGYEIPEDLLEDAGLFAPLTQITDEHKRNILANNYARIHGIDIAASKAAIADDEFSQARAKEPLPVPWSTLSKWDAIQKGRAAAEMATA
jgi:uncharacterized protein